MTAPANPPVSTRQLLAATAAALVVALAILFVAVLPAEYGIDPLRTGAALGLLRNPAPSATETIVSTPPALALTPTRSGPAARYAESYRTDTVEIELAPYDFVEYKYRLAEAATMVFSWTATAAVIQEFHGAHEDAAAGAEVTVEKGTASGRSGSLVAPFAGMHGWYWENPGGRPIRISLRSAGFYSEAVEYRSNRTRTVHPVGPIAPPVAATGKE